MLPIELCFLFDLLSKFTIENRADVGGGGGEEEEEGGGGFFYKEIFLPHIVYTYNSYRTA